MMHAYYHDTTFGRFLIAENGSGIVEIDLVSTDHESPDGCKVSETPLIREAAKQLDDYFVGTRKVFDLPLDPAGTNFQKKVWQELCRIPYGETRSYKQIAEAAGCPKGFRAVGMANNRNPIMIVVPCHRVIGSNGSLVGYAGGLWIKEKLLKHEGAL